MRRPEIPGIKNIVRTTAFTTKSTLRPGKSLQLGNRLE